MIRDVRRLLASMIVLGAIIAAPVTAEELRRSGFVGVAAAPVPDETRAAMALPPGVGVLVKNTVESGSASAAGIRANDVITALAGRDVAGVQDFVARVRLLRAGDTVSAVLRR